jgi:Sulfatase-modifying factor enzyme 1
MASFACTLTLLELLGCGGSKASSSGDSGAAGGSAGAGGSTASGGAAGSPFGGTGGENPFGGSGPGGVAGTSGSSGAAGAPSCAARCGDPGCPACQGPALISTHDDRGNPYRIDSTEVTNAQYSKFLAAQVDPASQPAYCASWNTAFSPNQAETGCQDVYDPLNRANYPVVCVNWCDADAYCRWAGKRLCEDFSYDQEPVPEVSRPALEWLHACDGYPDTQTFPFGNIYFPGACNGADNGTGELLAVGLSSCVGALPGLYDMSGNAREWNGHCSGTSGSSDLCSTAGGSFLSDESALECQPTVVSKEARSVATYDLGFRCCAD